MSESSKPSSFREGDVVGCSSNEPSDLLGHFLLSRGKINESQLRGALKRQETENKHLGRLLIEMQVLAQEELAAMLTAKSEETIYSVFDWEDAVFRFKNEDVVENPMPICLQVDDILLRGLKRWDEARMIREALPHDYLVLARTDKPVPQEIFSNNMARYLYELIDGERTIEDIILQAHGSRYQVRKFLFELHRHGYLRTQDERPPEKNVTVETEEIGEELLHDTCIGDGQVATLLEAEVSLSTAATNPDDLEAFEKKVITARRMLSEGQDEAALTRLEALYSEHPHNDPLRRLTAEAEAAYIDRAYRHWLPPDQIPVLKTTLESMESENLSPSEVFMLSRIDGFWDIKSIVQITPLREVEALKALKRMREAGWIELTPPQGGVVY